VFLAAIGKGIFAFSPLTSVFIHTCRIQFLLFGGGGGAKKNLKKKKKKIF